MLSNEEKIDPRVRRTRQMLSTAFGELLGERGFSEIGVNDIAGRAGVNRATFYAHFSDKYALLDHFISEEFRSEIDRRLLSACHYSPDNLRLLIVTVCEFVKNAHAQCITQEAQFHTLIETQIRNRVYELLDYWLENMDTSAHRPLPAQLAATAATWAIYGLAYAWSRAKPAPPAEQYAGEVLPLIAANLGVENIEK